MADGEVTSPIEQSPSYLHFSSFTKEDVIIPNGKPNILILWGDDIGWCNISHNNRGAMGYRTPNIDRIAREGIKFTTITASKAAPRGGPRSSRARAHCAPA